MFIYRIGSVLHAETMVTYELVSARVLRDKRGIDWSKLRGDEWGSLVTCAANWAHAELSFLETRKGIDRLKKAKLKFIAAARKQDLMIDRPHELRFRIAAYVKFNRKF